MSLTLSPRRRRRSALVLAGAVLLAVPACSSGDDGPSPVTSTSRPATTTTGSTAGDDTTTTGASDDADTDDDGAAPTGKRPEWAQPFTTQGDQIATLEGDGFRVDVYQVGTSKAPKDGQFVDPDTNEPILQEGDPVVFVNYVFTNTGDEPIPLSYSLVAVEARYADWKWAQGMDTVTDADLYEEMGVVQTAIIPGSGEAPFAWEPGTSFAMGDSFAHEPGGAITFSAVLNPADDEGELITEERQEVEVEATIA